MNSPVDHARALLARAQDDRYVLDRLAGDANARTVKWASDALPAAEPPKQG